MTTRNLVGDGGSSPRDARPIVSAVIPVYDGEATIDRALASVVTQTYVNVEIVVVDDASRDTTRDVVRRWMFRCDLNLVVQARNSGPAAARNAGLKAARGDYIAFLDSDDEWNPEKIAKQVRALEGNSRATLCACDEVWLYPDGTAEVTDEGNTPGNSGAAAWKRLLARPAIHTSSVLVRRDAALDLGGFDETLRIGEDQDFWIRLAHAGELVWVAESLVRVHNRPNGYMHANVAREVEDLLPMIRKHVKAYRSELTLSERRAILGRRLSQAGRNSCNRGTWAHGSGLILRSVALGHSPFESLLFLLASSSPGRWLKHRLS